ncbi:tRNA (adenosine(37)-N6)-threonylcarbamoyltransferase complex ATPase subunit type 1 TsaE [Thiorhodococcus mannitoliphagus]|uniref:tRNA threonylcarbamoyladenosine biosynthesis protein TsaE n=1 Tax=Thiorhodococcus mannitoliphagus TaxID=329406 RepID=A0A6P1DS33_9GAMM|nr:tRNA (adenosine(37)-N6)-threonylcarbamoyltransferase complex ATPase subunit type 1 TsaE [Thiorhodococcus mannitoliphagus]NEX20868.1 tRNA (adenosine(37)-N6)-threonylcarbamoyltransferase complex ATPase subunit type 1 TsaE [Thiorhodococcus mannitoliphagus]
MEVLLESAESQQAFGARLARAVRAPSVLYLEGDLGAGKTTLTRGLLHGLGHLGPVRSPTYTLIEPYRLTGLSLYHLDLYRLGDPEELDYLGLRDLLGQDALWVVEWPGRGLGFLPKPDLLIQIRYEGQGRLLTVTARTAAGEAALGRLRNLPD